MAVIGGVNVELAEFGGRKRGEIWMPAATDDDHVGDDAALGFGFGFGSTEEDDVVGIVDKGEEAGRGEFGGDVGGEIGRCGFRAAEREERGGKGGKRSGIGSSGATDMRCAWNGHE